MKNIIADFLRRWWGLLYLIIFCLAPLSMTMGPTAGLIFVLFLIQPFMLELGRNPVRAMTTLHVSRRTIALSYWSLAVLLPVLLMAVAIALEVLLFPRFAVSLENAALMLLGSLLFAGSFHCLSTVRCMTPTVVTGILTIIFLVPRHFQWMDRLELFSIGG